MEKLLPSFSAMEGVVGTGSGPSGTRPLEFAGVGGASVPSHGQVSRQEAVGCVDQADFARELRNKHISAQLCLRLYEHYRWPASPSASSSSPYSQETRGEYGQVIISAAAAASSPPPQATAAAVVQPKTTQQRARMSSASSADWCRRRRPETPTAAGPSARHADMIMIITMIVHGVLCLRLPLLQPADMRERVRESVSLRCVRSVPGGRTPPRFSFSHRTAMDILVAVMSFMHPPSCLYVTACLLIVASNVDAFYEHQTII